HRGPLLGRRRLAALASRRPRDLARHAAPTPPCRGARAAPTGRGRRGTGGPRPPGRLGPARRRRVPRVLHRPGRDREALPRAAPGGTGPGDDVHRDGELPQGPSARPRARWARAGAVRGGRPGEVRPRRRTVCGGRAPPGRGAADDRHARGPAAARGARADRGACAEPRGGAEGLLSALEGLRFADPLWLWAALLGPLVLAAALWRERRGGAIAFPGLTKLTTRPGWRTRLRHAPVVLAALGLTLASAALARPQAGALKQDVTTRGVDIVVALDVSGSMA